MTVSVDSWSATHCKITLQETVVVELIEVVGKALHAVEVHSTPKLKYNPLFMLDSAVLVPQAWNLMRNMTSTIMMVVAGRL